MAKARIVPHEPEAGQGRARNKSGPVGKSDHCRFVGDIRWRPINLAVNAADFQSTATRSQEIVIYLQETAIRSREIAADRRETAIDWSEIAIYSQEIAIDSREIAANKGETAIYTRLTATHSLEMAANNEVSSCNNQEIKALHSCPDGESPKIQISGE